MAQKQKLKQVKSPKGELSWPHLHAPEEWKGKSTGKLSIQAKFTKEESEAFITMLEQEYETARKSSEKFKGFKPARGTAPKLGFRELENGDIIFKFKTVAEFESKTGGEKIKRIVPVFDAKGKPLVNVQIGNGSIGRIAFSINPYCESTSNYGVSLFLDAIQLLKLVEYGANADASYFGFDEEEGYEVGEDEEENPFDSDPLPEDPEEGDF